MFKSKHDQKQHFSSTSQLAENDGRQRDLDGLDPYASRRAFSDVGGNLEGYIFLLFFMLASLWI